MSVLFAVLAGALTAASLNSQIWYLSILGIAVLLRTLESGSLKRRILRCGAFAGVYFLIHIHWISVLGTDVWIGLSIVCAIPWLLMAMPLPTRGSATILMPAALVVLIELIRSTIPFGGFPWGLIAYSQVDGPFVRLATLGGASLVTACVVALAATLNVFVRTWNWKLWLVPVALIIAARATPHLVPTGSLNVAVIQGNVPREGYSDSTQAATVAQNHLDLTASYLSSVASGARASADLIIWPESGTDIDPLPSGDIREALNQLADSGKIPMLVGASTWNAQQAAPMNAGILWLPQTGPQNMYVKNHLVPFGEYVPMRSLLGSVVGRLDQISNDFIPGTEPGIFNVSQHLVGDIICFEVAYGIHVRRTIEQGAQVIAVQTNNATYLGTQQPEQQFQITRFRAIEHQRTFVVASTSGISGIIDQSGTVVAKSEESTAAILTGEVTTISGKSMTDKFPYWTVLASLIFVMRQLLARRKRLLSSV